MTVVHPIAVKAADRHQALMLTMTVLIAVAVMLPASPILYPYCAERDGGTFLYIGERILEGAIPYRDVWDHKPPAILYLNAFSLTLGHTRWGVWVLETIAVAVAALLAYLLMARSTSRLGALVCSTVWLGQLGALMGDANYAEVFALPLQFAGLALVTRDRQTSLTAMCFGLTAGMALCLRPDIALIWGALFISYLTSAAKAGGRKTMVRWTLAMLAGSIAIPLVCLVCFASRGALEDLWSASVVYNIAYSQTTPGLAPRVLVALKGALWTSISMLLPLAVTGWLIGYRGLHSGRSHAPWLRTALLMPAAAVLSTVISGRSYGHYYVSWLPSCAMLACIAVQAVFSRLSRGRIAIAGKLAMVLLACASLLATTAPGVRASGPMQRNRAGSDSYGLVVDFVRANTSSGDYVLFWGAEATLNQATGRSAPTRFVYQYPLFTAGYQTPALIYECLSDLRAHPPTLIIDASRGTDKVPPLDEHERDLWVSPWGIYYQALPETEALYQYVARNYEPLRALGSKKWTVYKLR